MRISFQQSVLRFAAFGLLTLPVMAKESLQSAGLEEIFFEPKSFFLSSLNEAQTVALTGRYADGSLRDLTRQAKLSIKDAEIAEMGSDGRLISRSHGSTKLQASVAGHTASALVVVRASGETRTMDFATDIAPILSRYGCNASGCHGALNGQAGFKLSLFGYDPDADYQAIVKANEGRRVNLKSPEESLLLAKPSFAIAHGGGQIVQKDSLEYKALRDWIGAGAPQGKAGGPRLERLLVYPQGQRLLVTPGQQQQIVVIGKYSDGREVDMTRQVRYTPSDETVVSVTPEGLASAKRTGEVNVMVRSLGAVGVSRMAVVLRPPLNYLPKLARNNYIDDLVFEKLLRLRMLPSDLCSDSEFIRRVYLDVMGTLPKPAEVRAFLADRFPAKRERLVDSLFARPEYADFWSLKYGDLFTNSPQFLYNGTAYYQTWLREAVSKNKPYDQFARELLTSSGGTYQALPTNFYTVQKKPEDMATFVSQAFLGVSLECARCHDHPSEKWKRDDFMGLAAFFSQVKFKGGARNNERFLYIDPEKEFVHPQTKLSVAAKFLGADYPKFQPQEDRRARLAEWLTSSSNPYFAKAAVNRFWKELMGRGIVEPVDDFRVTNPPSHPELLERLAADFVELKFDVQKLMKRIILSRTYQLSAKPNATNADDRTAYSHYILRRLSAEQMADAISQATGVPERYPYFYPGKRAIQLPDPIVDSYFLTIFDRSTRENATCSRKQSASITQSLNLVSGETINGKLRHEKGAISRLVREGKSDKEIVEYLTLAALARFPTPLETRLAAEGIQKSNSRREGLEDFGWALLNSKAFLYNH
jgi:uncharacterized protein DUF1549/uncharacterized protein DUF1553/Big-like domain-containing protein